MRESRSLFASAAIFLLLIIATYWNHFNNSFHFDDAHAVVNNLYIRNIGNIPLFFKDATTSSSLPQNQSYRPLVYATLAIDYWMGGGLKPFYFHLSIFVLFIVQGILMYFLFVRIFRAAAGYAPPGTPRPQSGEAGLSSACRPAALLAVAFYMLHPANAETINYVTARSDTLSTLFIITALVMFIYSRLCRRWGLYLGPVAVAMLAKPVAVIFPILLFLYLILIESFAGEKDFSGSAVSSRLTGALKWSLPALLCCVGLLVFAGKMTPPGWTPGGGSPFKYLITQPYVILHYFLTFFMPVRLSADTDWQPLASLSDPRFSGGCLFLAILIFTASASARQRKLRPISFGLFWFFFALVPTSVTPLAEVTNDHRMFFPFVGLAMSVTWALALGLNRVLKFFPSKQAFYVFVSLFVGLVLIACAWSTHLRNEVWKSDESLWRDVTIKSPKNGRGLMNYGLALMARGDYAGAEKYYTMGLALLPYYDLLYINLGIVKYSTGKSAEAEEYFNKAISLNPSDPECYYNFGRFLKNQNRLLEALPQLYKALALAPAGIEARKLLMEVHRQRSEYAKVIDIGEETMRIAPDDDQVRSIVEEARTKLESPPVGAASHTPEEYLNLSLGYYRAGLYDRCIEAALEALQLKPDYDLAYNNICSAYNKMGMWDKAIEAGEKAVRLNPDNQLARNNLEWAKTHKPK